MGKVILLTGAPATGKSTLRENLAKSIDSLIAFDYGSLLLKKKVAEGKNVSYETLRAQSANIISASDVYQLDEQVIEAVTELRRASHVILDSHAVTREAYGFRAKTYSAEQLSRLSLDAVLVLRCEPDVILSRMERDRQGRNSVTIELAREHQLMQECVGLSYSITCGCPYFVLDTSALSKDDVKQQAATILSSVLSFN